jgi:hypothetical protein
MISERGGQANQMKHLTNHTSILLLLTANGNIGSKNNQ